MKQFIIAMLAIVLATAVSKASSQTMSTPNNGGGSITITGLECPGFSALRYAYSASSNGNFIEGCWSLTPSEQEVKVTWFKANGRQVTPSQRVYPFDGSWKLDNAPQGAAM